MSEIFKAQDRQNDDSAKTAKSKEVIAIEKKSCNNCNKHVWYIGGITENFVQKPDVHECTDPGVPYDLFDKYSIKPEAGFWWTWDPEILAKKCGKYDPIIVEKCENCEKEMGIPLVQVEDWADDPHEKIPVCSPECVKELNKEIEEFYKNPDADDYFKFV